MKSIAEILGGCQIVFGISFDIQEVFETIGTSYNVHKFHRNR